MSYHTQYIDKINSLKLELDTLGPIKEEFAKKLKKKFRLEFNYNSNHLEGNTLTYGQTELLLLFDKSSGDVPVSDLEEMKAHDSALRKIEELANDPDQPLTEKFIRELNKIILVKDFWKDAVDLNGNPTRKRIIIGEYKSMPNSVRLKNGEIHEYPSPEETPALMSDLIDWYRTGTETIHPVQLAAEFHYRFVCIHPFDDGNGRVARLAMNYILLKSGYPPVIIKSDDKESYLIALQRADVGEKVAIIEYVERQSIWSLELSIKAAKEEDVEEYDDLAKEIEILKRKKLTKSTIYKTPGVAHGIFRHVKDILWKDLEHMLRRFDSFFSESQTVEYVDDEQVERTTVERFHQPNTNVTRYPVFNAFFDETDIQSIEWLRNMMSLKSAANKIDIEISCFLKFYESNYKLEITGRIRNSDKALSNRDTIFEIENEYKTMFLSDEVDAIVRLVSKYMIDNIDSLD